MIKQQVFKLRVLRVITRMNVGGPARQVAYLHRAFEEAGHFSKVIYGQLGKGEADFSTLFHDKKNVSYEKCLVRELSLFKDSLIIFKILTELLFSQYDVIHTHTAKAGFCGRCAIILYKPLSILLGLKKTKVVHTYHGHVFSGYFNKSLEKRIKMVESFLWRFSDVLVALTSKLKKEIVEHLEVSEIEKMKVVPLGIDLKPFLGIERTDYFNPVYQKEFTKWVGWVGRLERIKNPERFISMAMEVIKERNDIGFVLVGDGSLRQKLQEMIETGNLGSHIFFYGWSDDLLKIYSGMDLLVNSSDNEGTPVTALEAIAAGIPVLATDVGGVKEVLSGVSECQVWDVNEEDGAKLLSEKIENVKELSLAIRTELSQNYSPDNLFRNLNKLYLLNDQKLT